MALGYRLFASQKWGDTGDGHVSGRDPERTDCFWLLREGVSFHAAHVDELVLVGPDGEIVEGPAKSQINEAAYFIHHPILEARPDLVSAAHVHTGWGTPFSAERRRSRASTLKIMRSLTTKRYRSKTLRAESELLRRWVRTVR